MVHLVIFDCDGVLVDSEVISATVLAEDLSDLGVAIDAEQAMRQFLGWSFPTIAAWLHREYSLLLPEDFEELYRTRLLAAFERQLRPTPGLDRLLPSLSVQTCVATSSSVARASRALALTGLDDFFAGRLFTASEVPHGKPAPDLFLHAASRMRVSPAKCLVIEDSAPGIEAAARAGMPSLLYTGGAHLRGLNVPPANFSGSLGRLDSWDAFRQQFPGLVARGSARMHDDE